MADRDVAICGCAGLPIAASPQCQEGRGSVPCVARGLSSPKCSRVRTITTRSEMKGFGRFATSPAPGAAAVDGSAMGRMWAGRPVARGWLLPGSRLPLMPLARPVWTAPALPRLILARRPVRNPAVADVTAAAITSPARAATATASNPEGDSQEGRARRPALKSQKRMSCVKRTRIDTVSNHTGAPGGIRIPDHCLRRVGLG